MSSREPRGETAMTLWMSIRTLLKVGVLMFIAGLLFGLFLVSF